MSMRLLIDVCSFIADATVVLNGQANKIHLQQINWLNDDGLTNCRLFMGVFVPLGEYAFTIN